MHTKNVKANEIIKINSEKEIIDIFCHYPDGIIIYFKNKYWHLYMYRTIWAPHSHAKALANKINENILVVVNSKKKQEILFAECRQFAPFTFKSEVSFI